MRITWIENSTTTVATVLGVSPLQAEQEKLLIGTALTKHFSYGRAFWKRPFTPRVKKMEEVTLRKAGETLIIEAIVNGKKLVATLEQRMRWGQRFYSIQHWSQR